MLSGNRQADAHREGPTFDYLGAVRTIGQVIDVNEVRSLEPLGH